MAAPAVYASANRGSTFRQFYDKEIEGITLSPDELNTGSKTNLLDSSKLASPFDPRTKQLIAISAIISVLIIGGVIGATIGGYTLYQPAVPTTVAPLTTPFQSSYQFIGQSCNKSSQCIASSFCDSTTYICSCSPEFYYDSTSGTCRPRKIFGESCSTGTECEFNMLLTCSSGTCQCDSMMYWSPYTHKCEDKRGLGETCNNITNECYSSRMVCSPLTGSLSNRCLCPLATTYFSFFTGDCETKKVYATTCSATFECIDYAWCTTFPSDSINRCNCKLILISYFHLTG
jgi:hypothetical protein